MIYTVLALLAWVVLAVLNMWIWQKGKAQSSLFMMIGAAAVALIYLLSLLKISFAYGEVGSIIRLAGLLLFTFGFFTSVKPLVEAQMAELKKKTGGEG